VHSFENIVEVLGRHDNHVTIVVVYLSFSAVVILLRIFAHLHFRGVLLSFWHTADKAINDKKEVKEIKHSVLKKACAEYVRVAERAVTAVPTSQIVERAVAGMGFFGWKYTGLLPFIEGMEIGLLGIGFVLAVVFGDNAAVYGLLAVIVFVACRLSAAFFNVRAARERLCDEMVLFIEREVGRFFAADTGGALLRLKNDLTDAIGRQGELFKTTMKSISESMVNAANSIGPIVAKAMDEKLINLNDTLTKTLLDWENALIKASEIQTAINTGAERFSQASTKIQSASDLLSTHMQGHSNALSEQLVALVSAINELKETQKALTITAGFVEKNQHALETSLTSYEASLQSLTQSIGDGLGAFINLHAQTSAQTINDAMKANIDKMMNAAQGGM